MLPKKRSVSISGHRTSYSLEDEFFECLGHLANTQNLSLAALIKQIDDQRDRNSNLSSALRLYVLGAARDGKLNTSTNKA